MSRRLAKIVELNDLLRTTFPVGKVVLTPRVTELDPIEREKILSSVRRFDDFTADNDPYGEHDFGAFDFPCLGRILWEIDYFDLSMESGSPDPADAAVTRRVLTIMLASEH